METLKDELRTMVQWQLLEEFQAWAFETESLPRGAMSRIEFEIPLMDPLAWLRQQKQSIKMYGRDRESRYEIAGIGAVDILTNCQEATFAEIFKDLRARLSQADEKIKYFGGIAFDPGRELDEAWKPFGQYYFLLPRFEIFKKEKGMYFACNFRAPLFEEQEALLTTLLHELQAIDFSDVAHSFTPPYFISRQDIPAEPDWEAKVKAILSELQEDALSSTKTALEKLVLSRKAIFPLEQGVDAFALLAVLRKMSVESFDFCFQPCEGRAFLGSTPELLYRRQGKRIASEAIAGTRQRGSVAEEDLHLERDLLQSSKDAHEHRLVLESVQKTLEELCHGVVLQKEMNILKLQLVQHLYSQLAGELKESVEDEDILEALHPTPGVLGFPKQEAAEALRRFEDSSRGWYAGPMGWVGKDEATFVVGIRSGLVTENQVTLFSGAGIVPGSSPLKEWDEIENKIRHFLAALGWDKKTGAFSNECM